MSINRNRLLPDHVYHPLVMLLMCTLPLLVLLVLQWHAFDLVRGELNSEERGAHLTVFAMLGVCITLSGALSAMLWKSRRVVAIPLALVIFCAGFGYLWAFMYLAKDLVPRSVGTWMLSGDELAYNNMLLIAPSLFYGLILLAGTPFGGLGRRDAAYSGLVVIVIPLFWVVLVQVGLAARWDVNFPEWLLLFALFAMTALMLLAFLRMLLHLHRWLGSKVFMPLLAGFVFPLAGLALNISIPFPTDLQDPRVYALTIVNAIAIALPATGPWLLPVWLLRVMMFPFTLYFFLLFLPFLPLSIPAMIVVGSGFLILAPTLLFVIHARLITTEGMSLAAEHGRPSIISLLLLALAIMPVGYIGRALWHKHALEQAINAVYQPDYAKADEGVDTGRALAALERLRDMKDGIYAPLLSEMYDTIVFGGMVLPDYKMKEMLRILGVNPLKEPPRNRTFEFFNFNRNTRNRRADWSRMQETPRQVDLSGIDLRSVTNGSMVESELILTMTNRGAGNAEYLGALSLPEGVAVSGYWLDVEGQRVDGRIFDRKTALWVFHMIRDRVRRDPGMIHFVGDNTLELRVFPFSDGQTRTCGIHLLYPAGINASVLVGERSVTLAEGGGTGLVEAGPGLLVPPSSRLPTLTRERYLHVLVDASNESIDFLPTVEAKIADLLARAPDIRLLRIDLVNLASTPVSGTYLDSSTWTNALRAAMQSVKPSGGFWVPRAINHAVFRHQHSEDRLAMVPAMVILSGKPVTWDTKDFLPEHAPDITVDTYDSFRPENTRAAVALRRGNSLAWIDPDRGGFASFDGDGQFEVYDSTRSTWIPVQPDHRLLDESRYARWAELRAMENDMASHPARAEYMRAHVLEISRDNRLLSRHTAFIVVEDSAQWKMLERKEKDSLKAKDALAFDEFEEKHVTPEPSTWLMIALLLPFAAYRWYRNRHSLVPMPGK